MTDYILSTQRIKETTVIDFKATSSTDTLIEYYNNRGELVKTYQLSELEQYVVSNELNVTTETISLNGKSQFDPEVLEQEILTVVPLDVYIDLEWFDLTEKFFNYKNK